MQGIRLHQIFQVSFRHSHIRSWFIALCFIESSRFSHAALAFESCGSKFRAVFAEPKTNSRSSNNSSTDRGGRFDDNHLSNSFGSGNGSSGLSNTGGSTRSLANEYNAFVSAAINTSSSGVGGSNGANNTNEYQLNIICSSTLNQDQLWRLFDIIPGLEYCVIAGDCGRTSNYATAAYNSLDAAHYARYVWVANVARVKL